MRGKWAQGIPPRHFTWVLKDRFAICERPGGYGVNHRRVRRQEEIIWLREQGFELVVSLCPSPHNLHNYDEAGVRWRHLPFVGPEVGEAGTLGVLTELRELLRGGARVILHRDEMGDHVAGVVGAYLRWTGLVPSGPEVITVVERLTGRQLGPLGRELIAQSERLADRSEAS